MPTVVIYTFWATGVHLAGRMPPPLGEVRTVGCGSMSTDVNLCRRRSATCRPALFGPNCPKLTFSFSITGRGSFRG
jgi:hypothetical protein